MVNLPHLPKSDKHPLKRIGQRGQVLLLLGSIYFLAGAGFYLNADDPGYTTTFAFPLRFAPMEFWGGIFAMVGVIAAVAAFWNIGRDVWGFAALVCWSSLWSCAALGTFFVNNVNRAWVTFLVWGAFAGVVAIVSGMRGPDDD